jgi:hypothetical protein
MLCATGEPLTNEQLESMLPKPQGAPVGGGRVILALPEVASIMEARFQPELWRMAGT